MASYEFHGEGGGDMSTVTATPLAIPSDPAEFYRLTVDQYERMVADGTIAEDEPVELLDGILVRTMPKGPRHETAVWRARRRIEREVPEGWHVRSEASVRIPDYNEPQPDVSVVRGDGDAYEGRHPGPGDLGLLVEVAEATLSRDRGEKRANYARAGITAYWIVNLVDDRLEVYSGPADGVYPPPAILRRQDSVDLVLDGRLVTRIAVADLLPKG
jgi:Uma2 family endonuclease